MMDFSFCIFFFGNWFLFLYNWKQTGIKGMLVKMPSLRLNVLFTRVWWLLTWFCLKYGPGSGFINNQIISVFWVFSLCWENCGGCEKNVGESSKSKHLKFRLIDHPSCKRNSYFFSVFRIAFSVGVSFLCYKKMIFFFKFYNFLDMFFKNF